MTQTIGPRAGSYSDASELSRFRELLGSEEFSIPLGSNFFIQIESIPTAIANTNNLQYFEPGRSAGWNIANGTNNLININKGSANGACLFANGITPPVEAINVARVGMYAAFDEHSGGLLDGVVTRSRKQQDSVAISFLETNQSFIDFVIRPWVILTGHVGLIARAPGSVDDVKTTITATFFSRWNGEVSPRKIFTFFGCAPVSIDTATAYDYGTNAVNTIKTTWAYNYYTLSFTDVKVPDPEFTTNNPTDFNRATAGTYNRFAPYQNVTGSATLNQPTNFNQATAGTFNPFVLGNFAQFAPATKIITNLTAKQQPLDEGVNEDTSPGASEALEQQAKLQEKLNNTFGSQIDSPLRSVLNSLAAGAPPTNVPGPLEAAYLRRLATPAASAPATEELAKQQPLDEGVNEDTSPRAPATEELAKLTADQKAKLNKEFIFQTDPALRSILNNLAGTPGGG